MIKARERAIFCFSFDVWVKNLNKLHFFTAEAKIHKLLTAWIHKEIKDTCVTLLKNEWPNHLSRPLVEGCSTANEYWFLSMQTFIH